MTLKKGLNISVLKPCLIVFCFFFKALLSVK